MFWVCNQNKIIVLANFEACVFVCVFVTDIVKTSEPIGPQFVEPQMTPEKVYGCSELQKFWIFVKF